MRILLLTIVLCLATGIARAQQGGVSPQEAARLDKTWKVFFDGMNRGDTALLRSMSLAVVYCPICLAGADSSAYVGIDKFFKKVAVLKPTNVWQAIATKKYWVNTIVTSERPANINESKKHFLIYELAFVTVEPGVIAAGHQGLSHLFQFVDINGTLKFYGLATVN